MTYVANRRSARDKCGGMTHDPKTCDEAGKRAQAEMERVRALAETMALDRLVATIIEA